MDAQNQQQRPRWSLTIKIIVTVALMVVFGLALYEFRIVLVPLIIGGIVAYLLQPVVRFICRVTRLKQSLATGLLYILLLAIVIAVGIAITPLLAHEIRSTSGRINELVQTIREDPRRSIDILGYPVVVGEALRQLGEAASGAVSATAGQALDLLFNATKLLLLTIFTLLTAFYLTADGERMMEWMIELVPPTYRQDARRLLQEMDEVWAAYFRGQVVLAAVVTLIMTGVSAALGLAQPILLGVLAGVLEFLVSLGHTIWIVIAVIVALIEGSTIWPVPNIVFALMVALAHLVFTKFDLSFLIPKITGERVRLHPLVVILGIIVGASVGGVLGVALAAPVIACMRILGRYVYAMLLDQQPFTADDIATVLIHTQFPEKKRPITHDGEPERQESARPATVGEGTTE